jgi:8-oxo-dGTP diphosphatase
MIIVTCAIIRNEDNEVLIVQRGEKTDHPFKWEFPGGKTTGRETNEECIIREVSEELSMDIVICGNLLPVEYDYGHKQIKLIPFICDTLDELPLLAEHLAFRWLPAEELINVDFSEADILVANQYIGSQKGITIPEDELKSEKAQAVLDDSELQSMINNMMSRQEADWVATSALENPAIFLKLLEYSYTPDRKLAFRASWTLSKVCDRYPEIIYPYLSEIIEALPRFDNESVQRSFLRIISISNLENLTGKHHGLLADYSFSALNSGLSAIAIKAYSMEILFKLSLIYPEIANELASSIRILMEDGSAGIVAKGNTILKRITGIPLDR